MKKVFVKLFSLACLLCILSLCGCKKSSSTKGIAVFVPGICDDSPVYAMLVQGVKNAVNEFNQKNSTNVELFIMEAGTNQAEWATKLTALAAEQRFDVIISSNPSLPDLAVPILEQFPSQKFILLDATLE
ncbi:MAG: BMP family ABC transporter substrate-binding protein, partial [Treponema sp.]|nr:BMP family ABC transporter substrate-binding protein [Treponema sp.]